MNVATLAVENLERFGEYEALWYQGAVQTNVDRYHHAGRMARVLLEFGIGPSDVVVVMMPNSPDVTAAFVACWRIGAVICPVTPMLTAREVSYMIADSQAKAVLTSPELAGRVRKALSAVPGERHLLVIGESDAEGAHDVARAIATACPIDGLLERSEDALALLLYTSGTTGNPKGVMLSHRNLLSNARSVAAMADDEPKTRSLAVLPLSHAFGVLLMNVGNLLGTQSILLPRWDTIKVFESVEAFRPRQMSVVPTMLTLMLHHPDRERYDLSSLERVSTGGAALPEQLRLEFAEAFRCKVRQGYGLSEASTTLTRYRDAWEYRPGSVGRALPDVEICIFDSQDRAVPAREVGEICARGPNIMIGYLNKPEATAEVLSGGWLHTGDIGYLDEDGFVFITDRKKELIIKGGENISPREIEEVLYRHPHIADAAVVGIPDATYGENVCAVIVLKPEQTLTEEEAKTHVGRHLTKFKIPAQVLFFSELPKNPTGKIQKRAIVEQIKGA